VTTVIPFRAGGKSRLPVGMRRDLALAMLADVVETALVLGETRVVTDDVDAADTVRELGAVVVPDPGGGQSAAVEAALATVAGPCLVVNSDLPLATSEALARLAAAAPALVAASDGTTNALALAGPGGFRPLYGPGSAARFAAAGLQPVAVTELEHDVDTLADLERLPSTPGGRTTLVLNQHKRRSPT
jgi:2-phospho-L-lactate/phosphoenolpyruvate guanylyltransferase